MSRHKSIDLVAEKDGKKIAIEIETGKNNKKQIKININKIKYYEYESFYFMVTKGEIR